MPGHVYRIIEVAASLEKSIEDANSERYRQRVADATGDQLVRSAPNPGQVEAGKLQYQVVLKVGLTL